MNGLLLINKPGGMTSHDVVSRVRKILQTREVGHSGTLDPLATGLMVLLIGEATKLSSYVTEGHKSYKVGVRLGVTTDTLDITGQVLSEQPVSHTPQQVVEAALGIHGDFELPIPLYSAKKIDGKKLYEYAREGEAVSIPKKKMSFWQVQSESEHCFSLFCSKGSFIRSWVELLGQRLGCGATMSSLERTSSHHFSLSEAVDLDALSSYSADQISQSLIPMERALNGVKSLRISGQDAVLMRNGQISHSLRSKLIVHFNPEQDEIVQILQEKKAGVLALIGLEKGQGFKVKRVFNS